jgi:putative ABC transport system ATP-binding protein
MNLVQRLNRERGLTVILVTHAAHVAVYAGRVLRQRDGSHAVML